MLNADEELYNSSILTPHSLSNSYRLNLYIINKAHVILPQNDVFLQQKSTLQTMTTLFAKSSIEAQQIFLS